MDSAVTERSDGELLNAFADRIMNAIQEGIREEEYPGGGMVTDFVLVASYAGEDGEPRTILSTPRDARLPGTLGLIDFAQTVWREEAREWAKDKGVEE